MAKTIGSLNVSMGLSITDFITNLDKVKEDMSGLEAITSQASKHFDDDVAGIMGDALHKFAKTSKLGADDALKFAVSLKKLGLDADTITSTLDKFGKGIGKFAKNAGEASKAFAGILGKIGESDKVLLKDIQALESMGVKAFDAMAKELSKVEGKAVTTAEVMKRIASGAISGKDALKLLTQGGQAQAGGGVAAKESQAKSKLTSFLNYVENKISSAASSIFSKVTSLIMNPVTLISGALASYGVYKIYDRAVDAFANTEEILTRIKGLAGDASADRLGGVMNGIANQGRIAQEVVGKLATGFLGLGVSGSDAAQMIESFGRISLIAGSGASDVFGKLGEVAQNMTRTGQASKDDFEALASMGLPVYEALAQRLSLVQGKAISANEAMRMLAEGRVGTADALNAISGMSNNADVIKQSEAMAGTLKGIYARLAGEIEGFFTEFGGVIVEALDLKGFSQGLIGFMQNLRANFDSLIPAIKNIGMVLSVVRDVLFQAFSGLVNFFTTMGGADVVAGNINNIRAVVVSFAQAVMVSMQSVMSGAITVINEIIKAVGGLKKFAAIFAGVAIGAKAGGVLGGLGGGGIGAIPGMLIGGVTGGLYANSKVDGGGPGIDAEAIKKKMNDAFKSILESIGNTGMNTAEGIVAKFMKSFNDAFAGASSEGFDTATALDKIESNFHTFTDGLHLGMLGETIGYGAFLKQLSGGTASAIAMFQRQLALGNISAEEMGTSLEKVKDEAFAALDMQLSAGTITNEEYANTIAEIQTQFDSLNPPEISGFDAFKGGDNMPAWIRDLSKEESPLEAYQRKLEELKNTLQDRPDLFAVGAAKLADELERSVGAVEALKNPGALMQGSSAAFSQALKIQNAGKGETAAEKLLRIQQQAFSQQQAQTALQQQIAAATMNQANMIVANIN
jgi:hypothetical protein